MGAQRPLDRLDHRLAARRLRGKHVRAVGRALAERGAGAGTLSCADVSVGKDRTVRFAAAPDEAAGAPGAAALALAQDLAARRAPQLAEQLLAAYALAADDYAVLRGLPPVAGRPLLVLAVGGLVASGKSTVAKYVGRRIGAPRVVADRVRRALLAAADAKGDHELAWDPALGDRVYAGLFARAREVLASGRSVLLDACFPNAERRRAAAALAAQHGARFVFVCCTAPREDIAARLRLRDVRDATAPGAWRKLAAEVEAGWEAPRPGEAVPLDTSLPRHAWLRRLGLAREARA